MNPHKIIVHDDVSDSWLSLTNLFEERACYSASDLPEIVDWAEAAAKTGLWVSGFLRYEAATAFDSALQTSQSTSNNLPLAWFGAFSMAERVPDPGTLLMSPVDVPPLKPQWNSTQYCQQFERVKAYLAAGDAYQINLTFRLDGHFQQDCYGLFAQLCSNQAGRYSAYLEFDDWVVMSASPELLFERCGQMIETRPMKGTILRGKNPAEDELLATRLKSDPKNQAENLMIVDMIRNDLSRVSRPGSVEVVKLFEVERYPRIQQMTSSVQSLSDEKLSAILASLFPCASITGAPKARAVAIIAELEASARDIYTGSIGLIKPQGDCQFSVAIRTAVWHRPSCQLSFGVGSGIVWDSQSEDEYQECLLKANILGAQTSLA